jgi:signal transduction histidine kinase
MSLEELTCRIAELEAAVEARDNFIAVAAHELRSPLSTMLLSLANVEASLDRIDKPPTVDKALNALHRSIDNFSRRAATLLDITRLTAGNFSFEPEWVQLDALIERVVAANEHALRVEHCELQLNLQPVRGFWDRLAIEQIIDNLLSNAIKYGAGEPVAIHLSHDETTATLSVVDQGVGIGEEDQARMFAKFERAFKRSEYGGFGMGLWITAQIVHAHAGEVRVSSRINEGSEFTVSLPLKPEITHP